MSLDTSHLHGLRGVASLLVYIHHHELWAHNASYDTIERAFGYRQRHHFITLPFIRLVFNGGHFATAVFFVLSGYVLSVKPLTIINCPRTTSSIESQERLACYISLAIFRRWFRLFIPVFVTTFTYMSLLYIFGLHAPGHSTQAAYSLEFRRWMHEVLNFSFIFDRTTSPWPSYNDHLWSLAIEFKGSLATYTCLAVLSRSTIHYRLVSYILLIVYFLFLVTDGWFCAFFIAGLSIRDLEIVFGGYVTSMMQGKAWTSVLLKCLLSGFGLYMAGVPTCLSSKCFRMNPGWSFLSPLPSLVTCDPKWVPLFCASVLFVPLVRHTWLKRPLQSSIFQYLGRNSYSLYLIHGPVLRIFGDSLYACVSWPYGDRRMLHTRFDSWAGFLPITMSGPFGMEGAFLAVQAIMLPISLSISHFVTHTVDEPCVRLSKMIVNVLLGKEQ
ncbi:uncharacterized protein FPRO_15836 [Fusarium proliferatum ET1]|uniref:Related to hard surface induced protein 3 n=1 Tax=Fusarium proliferatum (strain ET1) TaxID=1227346 RepID=A0A1L7WA23_FUSPR|nr:uncharacterized protein FPRO_15836 [Fusarium proliferatum ET1]CZR49476.1 related to hard surface induced protein 3 [Fusarium proliferatum ET1]